MKVLKFGGTSVGTVESLNNVKKIVESIPGKAVIVVSALGGLTDKLIATARMASSENEGWEEEMESIRQRHYNIIENVVADHLKEDVRKKVTDLLNDLERNYKGLFLLRTLPDQVLDIIVSFGERMSSVIVAAMVENGKRYYSPDFVKTEKRYGKNVANVKETDRLICETFQNMDENEKAIVPGFISSDATTGEITNLGRGGSDYTGALIAAALDSEVLEIWTDVDGFMTADPRIVKDALLINHLTFTESMELCTFGAKVIYPPTIYPVFLKNIPIMILNTFNLKAPGTRITDEPLRDDFEVKGVTALKDVAIIVMDILSPVEQMELVKRGLNALAKEGVRIIPVNAPEENAKLVYAIPAGESRLSLQSLEKEFAPEIGAGILSVPAVKDNQTAVAVVGKDMRNKNRLAQRVHHSLFRHGINVEATSSANSDTTLIYIINQEKSPEALPLIHSLIF